MPDLVANAVKISMKKRQELIIDKSKNEIRTDAKRPQQDSNL